MPNILLRLNDEQHKDLKNLKPTGTSWGDFIHTLATGENNLSMQENLSLEEIRQEIKDHVEEYIQVPTSRTYDHSDVVDDVKEHLLAHMQNKHLEHQQRHDEINNRFMALSEAVTKITHVATGNTPQTTLHNTRNRTDVLALVESCAIKRE